MDILDYHEQNLTFHDYAHMIVFVVVRDTHDYGYLVHQDMSYYFMFDHKHDDVQCVLIDYVIIKVTNI